MPPLGFLSTFCLHLVITSDSSDYRQHIPSGHPPSCWCSHRRGAEERQRSRQQESNALFRQHTGDRSPFELHQEELCKGRPAAKLCLASKLGAQCSCPSTFQAAKPTDALIPKAHGHKSLFAFALADGHTGVEGRSGRRGLVKVRRQERNTGRIWS